jgi:DNA-binding transcriptional LysR family regulator
MCKPEIESGQLVSVLPKWTLDLVEAHAVYPAGRTPSKKVRLFTEFLADILSVL